MSENGTRMGSVLDLLDGTEEEFKKTIDRLIKASIRMIKRTEALKEELKGIERITQINVDDVDLHFWFELRNGDIDYNKGYNEDATLEVSVTRKLISKIIKQEIRGGDAFMKGMIKLRGRVSQGIRAKNFLSYVLQYLNKLNKRQPSKT